MHLPSVSKQSLIIFGNYGNPTIAAIQWAFEQELSDITVISIDTGWSGAGWNERVAAAEKFVKQCGYTPIRLKSKPGFQELMIDRGNFPSTKFQWCAGFLKGLTLLDWLDANDPAADATIILGKKRLDSKLNFDLPEFIEASEHYGDRKIWYPLFNYSDEQYQLLLQHAQLPILTNRSLECDPCVNSFGKDLARLANLDIAKTKQLESSVGKNMFSISIDEMLKQAKQNKEKKERIFDMGCGSPFACGE